MRELEAGLNAVGIWLHDNALREAFELLDVNRNGHSTFYQVRVLPRHLC